ncbi:uL22 family ribosomal protein, partial [Novipirellula maiorica]
MASFTAHYRNARISAQKVRLLANLVRGMYADEALDTLKFQPQRGARMLEKCIKSA